MFKRERFPELHELSQYASTLFFVFSLLVSSGCSPNIQVATLPTENPLSVSPAAIEPVRTQTDTDETLVVTPTLTLEITVTPTGDIQSTEFTPTQKQITMICSPLEGHSISELTNIVSDPYNPPPEGKDRRHMGVDFSYYQWNGKEGIEGTQVESIFSGKVSAVMSSNHIPYGYAVIIETPIALLSQDFIQIIGATPQDSLYTMYAHLLEAPQVTVGSEIECGDRLGYVGQTGGEDTPYAIPHLHVEMRLGTPGIRFEDMGFYDTRLTEAARQNYIRWRTSGEFRHFDPMLIINSE